MNSFDTIVARATPAGKGAIAVVRVSGPTAFACTDALLKNKISLKNSHTALLRQFFDANGMIDEALVVLFKGPKSYTGEDTVEISVHGSDYIVNRLIAALLLNGCRVAEPGEFTQRAFLNGKLDLAQAEAVADIIVAEHRFAHDQALKQLRGGFSGDIDALRDRLLHFTSLIELELDFGEEDVEFASRDELTSLVTNIKHKVDALKDSFALGNALKQGFTLVLAGRPNAGKSTLFNALLNEDKAIVSDIAGTTRDAIEDRLFIEGLSLRLIDTAGIREATDVIEQQGIARTFKHIEMSGATLYLFEIGTISPAELESDLLELISKTDRIWVVANKLDSFLGDIHPYTSVVERITQLEMWQISANDRLSVLQLTKELASRFQQDLGILDDQTVVTNARHANSLLHCSQELQHILDGITNALTGDLLSFHLRSAISALSAITGHIDNEEVLGNIFSKFCIGK
jgi:tRNA modification GTPase